MRLNIGHRSLLYNGDILLQRSKDKALEYGENKIKMGGQYYDLQMRQIVGHIYFEKKNFAKALPTWNNMFQKHER